MESLRITRDLRIMTENLCEEEGFNFSLSYDYLSQLWEANFSTAAKFNNSGYGKTAQVAIKQAILQINIE